MFLVSTCSCICPSYWCQVLSGEWRCSWSSADTGAAPIKSEWSTNLLPVKVSYVRDLTVYIDIVALFIKQVSSLPQSVFLHFYFTLSKLSVDDLATIETRGTLGIAITRFTDNILFCMSRRKFMILTFGFNVHFSEDINTYPYLKSIILDRHWNVECRWDLLCRNVRAHPFRVNAMPDDFQKRVAIYLYLIIRYLHQCSKYELTWRNIVQLIRSLV